MLCDQFGRTHNYLRISLTEKCNLRCSYCMPEEGIFLRHRSLFMNKEEVVELARIFVSLGIKKIRLTGGEPLVCKDAHEIISQLSKLPAELAITTNGILANEYLSTFKKNGINSINISLDTLNPERFIAITRRDEFARVMSNIHLLLSEHFTIKLNMVVMRGVNEYEIVDFVKLTKDLPVHVRFIEFMPFRGNKWEQQKVYPMNDILSCIKANFHFEKLADRKHETTKKFKVCGHAGTFAVISTISQPFCSDCNRLRLTADGKLKNCLFSMEETDLLTPYRRGEDVERLIYESVFQKKEKQGGRFDAASYFSCVDERSMVAIGG